MVSKTPRTTTNNQTPFTPRDNASITTLDDAKNETRSRVKFLVRLNKSNFSKNTANAELREVVWRIQKSYFEWKQWRHEIAAVLNEEGYAEVVMGLIKQVVKNFNPKDEGLYKLSRNLFGSAANFSDYPPFGKNMAKCGAIEVILTYLSNEIQSQSGQSERPTSNFLTKSSLQLLLNLMKTPTYIQEITKAGAMDVFPVLISGEDEEVKCLAALCHLNLLNKRKPQDGGYYDEKNVGLVFIKAIKAWLDSAEQTRSEVRVSLEAVEALVDGLCHLCSHEPNKAKLLQNGVIEVIQRLLEFSNQSIGLRSVNVLVALFSNPSDEKLLVSDNEASHLASGLETIKMLSKLDDNSNVTKAIQLVKVWPHRSHAAIRRTNSPVQKPAQPDVPNPTIEIVDFSSVNHKEPITSARNDENAPPPVKAVTPPTGLSVTPVERWATHVISHHPPEEPNRILFKENAEIGSIQEAITEMQSRAKYLDELAKLSPPNIVCNESKRAMQLITSSLNHWPSKWQPEIAQMMVSQENFPATALPYLKALTEQFLSERELQPAMVLASLYAYLSGISEYYQQTRKDLVECGFLGFLFDFLKKAYKELNSEDGATSILDGIVAEVINLLNNISQSPELCPDFYKYDAIEILADYSESPVHGFVVNRCIARLASVNRNNKADESVVKEAPPVESVPINDTTEINEDGAKIKPANDMVEVNDEEGAKNAEIDGDIVEQNAEDLAKEEEPPADNGTAEENHDGEYEIKATDQVDTDNGNNNILFEFSFGGENETTPVIVSTESQQAENDPNREEQIETDEVTNPIHVDNDDNDMKPATPPINLDIEEKNQSEAEGNDVQISPRQPETEPDDAHSTDGIVHDEKTPDHIEEAQIENTSSAGNVSSATNHSKTPDEPTNHYNNPDDKSLPPLKMWTSSDVKKWLVQENLYEIFGDKMTKFDGAKLWMLLEIEKKAPEHYYKIVSKHFDGSLPNMLQLYCAFSQLSSTFNIGNE